MATLLEIRGLLYNENMVQRVEAAVLVACNAIINEDIGTANHADRLTWATAAIATRQILRETAEEMLTGVCSNATIQSSGEASTDNDIQFVVNGLVNTYAG